MNPAMYVHQHDSRGTPAPASRPARQPQRNRRVPCSEDWGEATEDKAARLFSSMEQGDKPDVEPVKVEPDKSSGDVFAGLDDTATRCHQGRARRPRRLKMSRRRTRRHGRNSRSSNFWVLARSSFDRSRPRCALYLGCEYDKKAANSPAKWLDDSAARNTCREAS